MLRLDPLSRSDRLGITRLRLEGNRIVGVDNNRRHLALILGPQDMLLESGRRLVVEHELAHNLGHDLRRLGRGNKLRVRSFGRLDGRLDQRWRRLLEEVDDAAEVGRVRVPHLELVGSLGACLHPVVRHHPPVAARGEGAGVVFDCHGFRGCRAWCDGPVVALVLIDIAVFMGDAGTADGVRGVVLDFDEGGALGEAEGEREPAEDNEELSDL